MAGKTGLVSAHLILDLLKFSLDFGKRHLTDLSRFFTLRLLFFFS